MKRILSWMICSLWIICLFTACQPTPEEKIIVNKNDGKLEEKIMEDNVEEQNPNEADTQHITKEIVTKNGIKINLDASVEVPEVGKYPVVKVRPVGFSEQQVTEIIRYLSGGATLYQNITGTMTKEWVDRFIIDAKKQIAELQNSDDPNAATAIANLQNSIASMESSYGTYPNESELSKTEVDLQNVGNNPDLMFDLGKEEYATFNVTDNRGDMNKCTLRFSNMGFNGGYTDHHYQKNTPAGVSISLEDAIETAQDVLKGIGAENMELADVLVGNRYNNNIGMGDESQQCYALYFTRSIEGIKTAYTQLTAWKANAIEGELPENYRNPWTPEYITIQIDSSGFVSLEWYNPVEIMETENENVEIISFDQVMKKFADNMDILVANADLGSMDTNELTVSVNRIILGMQYVSVRDNYDVYRMVPCWIFKGHDTVFAEEQNYNVPTSEMTINAVDGSLL